MFLFPRVLSNDDASTPRVNVRFEMERINKLSVREQVPQFNGVMLVLCDEDFAVPLHACLAGAIIRDGNVTPDAILDDVETFNQFDQAEKK